jgi:hypothetical protein
LPAREIEGVPSKTLLTNLRAACSALGHRQCLDEIAEGDQQQ